MFAIETHLQTASAPSPGQDRGEIIPLSNRAILAIADGAGGSNGGKTAAESVISAVHAASRSQPTSRDDVFWAHVLTRLDRDMTRAPECGESTAVIIEIAPNQMIGASVGDSEAWFIQGKEFTDLTTRQFRKPLIGSGEALPMPFRYPLQSGTLLLASDGLFKYAPANRIIKLAKPHNLETASEQLVNAVRLRSGDLQDDVAIALCRISDH